MHVSLIESRPQAGRGVAYSTCDPRHLLNVPAFRMSAYPEDGDHFLRWLDAQGHRVEAYSFVPRRWYGEYLVSVLHEAECRAKMATLHRIQGRVSDIELRDDRCQVRLDSGDDIAGDVVVLAVGHLGVDTSWAPDALVESDRFVADPWAPGSLDRVPDDADVLIVGTGLTMVDTFLGLQRPGRVVHAISRHGRLPVRHAGELLPNMEAPEFASASPSLAELREVMERHCKKAMARYGDWRPAIDSVREITAKLWAGLCEADRAEFVALDARSWDAVRHRMPSSSADAVENARARGTLVTHQARVVGATPVGDGLEVVLSNDEVLRVGAVVNCTGPCDRPERTSDPFIRRLRERGLVRSGPLGIGLDTDSRGRVRDARGSTANPIWTLAALRRGSLWESTAMPEVREQAAALARGLVRIGATTDHRPTDQYDLKLSTTADAAESWSRALDAIRSVQAGAERDVREAVALDPAFAVGHAALALLGREWGAPVDIERSLHQAIDAIRLSGDARERSFVHMVTARLTQPKAVGDQELLRHVTAYPRDCFAVSVALPTIAFSGLAGPVEQSWALVDRLTPSYGDDWWFAGVLAFIRQEQERWSEAETLAQRAMQSHPESGHAAHAQTHVFYETGSHVDGLAWLDAWIAAHGHDTNHRAHYSWHAALHELALDDMDAVRRRYDAQLAPPTVTGARALVDSASLLWRLQVLSGSSPDSSTIEVFDCVDDCVFDRPSTPFTALHAVVGLALVGDSSGINRMGDYAVTSCDPTFVELIAPLCRGFGAVVEGRPADAIGPLTRVCGELTKLGGSAAQQEVVTETLLYALVQAGRSEDARNILSDRLDRRQSPGDRRRLGELAG